MNGARGSFRVPAPANPPDHSVCCYDTVLRNPTRSCARIIVLTNYRETRKAAAQIAVAERDARRERTENRHTRNQGFLFIIGVKR